MKPPLRVRQHASTLRTLALSWRSCYKVAWREYNALNRHPGMTLQQIWNKYGSWYK